MERASPRAVGTGRHSEHINTDFTEKKIMPQISTQKWPRNKAIILRVFKNQFNILCVDPQFLGLGPSFVPIRRRCPCRTLSGSCRPVRSAAELAWLDEGLAR
jgi:hypothetical protein